MVAVPNEPVMATVLAPEAVVVVPICPKVADAVLADAVRTTETAVLLLVFPREYTRRLLISLLFTPVVRMDWVPSSRLFPLKLVVLTMRSMEAMAESIWAWLADFSLALRPASLLEATTSDSISPSKELISAMAPSATVSMASARWLLFRAPLTAVSSALSDSMTINPAGSSEALLIFNPVDSWVRVLA